MTNVQSLIENFTTRLASLLESRTLERAREAVESALGVKRPGRPVKITTIAIGRKPRKKPPVQLCPVPGCRSPAAPVYGMVCAQHKDVSKAKIKKYREARRDKKLGIKRPKAVRRAKPIKKKVVKQEKAAKRGTKKATRPAVVAAAA